MMRNKLPILKYIRDALGSRQIPNGQSNLRFLFHPYSGMDDSPCGLIDEGMCSGYKRLGQVVIWNSSTNHPNIDKILKTFRPTHFIGYLQTINRTNPAWITDKELWNKLNKYRINTNMKVVLCSNPSNIDALYGDWYRKFSLNKDYSIKNVSSYYTQENRPNTMESRILESGFVDLITSRYCYKSLEIGYKNFIDLSIPILSEPPAASDDYNTIIQNENYNLDPIDILYIGNCWPFKWDNMKNFVIPLKAKYGNRFQIYGNNWPDALSNGPLGNGFDKKSFSEYTCKAKINLTFHEPSQTLDIPTSTNERIFKLLSLSSCVVSDNCTANRYYFKDKKSFFSSGDHEEMIENIELCINNQEVESNTKSSGKLEVESKHTYYHRAKRVINVLDTIIESRELLHDFF